MHFLGKLWMHLNLDLLIVVKNAPRDNRFNPVEHLWGYLTPKISGMVLPTTVEENEDLGVESPEVLNQAIDILKNTFASNKFNRFEVEPVAVHCDSEEI